MTWPVRWAAALTLTGASVLLTGCLGTGTSAPQAGRQSSSSPPHGVHSTLPTPTPALPVVPPPPPPAKACYRLGYAEALAPTLTKKPAPCSGTHTAATFFVGTYRKALPVDGTAVHTLEATVCPRRFAAYVGGTPDDRRLSMLRTVWFAPSVRQAARGAHWFACVAIALQSEQRLAFLRGPVEGALASSALRDHYALCGTAEPGSAGFEQRICAAPHAWRALRTIDFAPGRYPGTDQVQSAGRQPCQDAGKAVASDPLNYQWSYAWPTLRQWRACQTYGVCWAPG